MTAKEFFKGNVFRSLAVLLIIVILSSGILAICNDLLKVSDANRINRVIAQIYGKDVDAQKVEIPENGFDYDGGSVSEAYLIKDDGNYLVKSTGNEGYKNGTVTLWVVVEFADNAIQGIGKVKVDSYEGQTLMANFNDAFFAEFDKHDEEVAAGAIFATEADEDLIPNTVTGTTKSANAICNAVNTAVDFVKRVVLGEDTPVVPVGDGLLYAGNISKGSVSVKRGTVTYNLTVTSMENVHDNFVIEATVDKSGTLTKFAIVENGSSDKGDGTYADDMYPDIENLLIGKNYEEIKALIGQDGNEITSSDGIDPSLQTGATYSNLMCLTAAAYATGNYGWFTSAGLFVGNVSSIDFSVKRGTVSYTLTVTSMENVHDNFVIDVAVKNGAITEYTIVENGSSDKGDGTYADDMYPDIENFLIGKTYEDIKALLGGQEGSEITSSDGIDSSLHTGATYSNLMCVVAAAFATGNYSAFNG